MSNNHLLPPAKKTSKKQKHKIGFVQVSESDTDESLIPNLSRNNTPSPCHSGCETIMSKVLKSLKFHDSTPEDGKGRKKKREAPIKRDRSKSNYSLISLSEVTEGALQIWRSLPEKIRQDPSLASFRQENERIHGPEHDADPLPNEDNSISDDHASTDGQSIKINVTNELGETITKEDKQYDASKGEHDDTDAITGHKKPHKLFGLIKMCILLAVWCLFTLFLMKNNEKELSYRQMSIPSEEDKGYIIPEKIPDPRLGIVLQGAFLGEHYHNLTDNYVFVYVQLVHMPQSTSLNSSKDIFNLYYGAENLTDVWKIPVASATDLDTVPELKKKHTFELGEVSLEKVKNSNSRLRVVMTNNIGVHVPVNFAYDPTPIDKSVGIIYATIVLLGLYIMIIWEVLVHRTFAALIASTTAIGILAAMNERPTMADIMSWIDTETLLLLFGMMILVAILSETGIFDYLAVYAYKITNGKVWPLVNCLCLFTAVLSSFLDNVTTVLLMTPVTIRLCEVMGLNPVPILMSMVIYSNIGGALTPVGDPPNVIIASNSYIAKNGVNFTTFTMHMAFGIFMVMIQTYIHLRFKFKNVNDLRFSEAQDVQELRHEIAVWQRAAASLSSYSKDEDIVRETLEKKCTRLTRTLKKKLTTGSVPIESYKATLEDLEAKYPIRNKTLLVKSGVTLIFVISFFFLHSVPSICALTLGWTALLGAILLLILADREDMEAVLARVEWSTLLFFAALFVLMECLAELGLIDFIGKQTENVILSVGKESRLAVAILLILWVSAIASAFVDNIPLTTMMIKIAISLAENESLDLPLQPLVWALAFGACLGGNGTLIGASANVVCAGVAEQHGYRFTFIEYFKVGFPVMLGSIVVATAYLMFAHVLFTWH
uniref:CSON000900 protein n=1 Tax=Culicoides sonorensis TaxID=179676 RepID=A0A336LQF6_CULSO